MHDILRSQLFNSHTGQGKWVVIPAEAGTGKSVMTDNLIGRYLSEGGLRRFLLVKPFRVDMEETLERINLYADDYSGELAVGITSENWSTWQNSLLQLRGYPVTVITHERYKRLSRDAEMWHAFADGRDVLVVDEAIQPEVYSFKEEYYKTVVGQVSYIIDLVVRNACEGLFAAIERLRPHNIGNKLLIIRPISTPVIDASIGKLDTYLKVNSDIAPEAREVLQKFIRTVTVLYNSDCLYSGGTLYGYDKDFRFATLEHNLILDANGHLDTMYQLNPHVQVMPIPRTTDHSRWTLHHLHHNSSKSKIGRTPNYWDEICKEMKRHQHDGAKTLVVCHMVYESALQSKLTEYGIHADTSHFGALIGRNNWRTHNQVWIVGTPYAPFAIYPILHAMASGCDISQPHIEMYTSSQGLAFADGLYNTITDSQLLGTVYQAVKRINRDNAQAAQVFVVTNKPTIVSALAEQMRGIRLGHTIHLQTKEIATQQRRIIADDLVEWLVAHRGTHTKKAVCEAVGIRSGHLARHLKHDKVERLLMTGKLRIYNKVIEVM